MNRTKRIKIVLMVSLVLAVVAMGFQNCSGNIHLSEVQLPLQVPELPRTAFHSEICPVEEQTTTFKSKVIFIVDMSLSNVGGRNPARQCMFSSIPPDFGWSHSLGGGTAYDRDGQRFSALNQLIPLISSESTRNVSVMGFHDSAIFGNSNESCNSDFLNSTQALNSVTGLQAMQNWDLNYNPVCTRSPNPPFKLKGTRYRSALECLKSKMEYDLYAGTSTEKSFYNVVFLTDGQPEDADGNNFPQMLRDLYTGVQRDILGLKLIPVYYGPTGGQEQTNAVGVLDPMAGVLDSQIRTLVLDNLNGLKDMLLDDLSTTSKVQFGLKNFHAFNLTAINQQGSVLKDSNMNGIPDEAQGDDRQTIRDIFDSFSSDLNEDGDALPSFVEKIRGLREDIDDYGLDMDLDGLSNGLELAEGRDPRAHESEFLTPDIYLTKHRVGQQTTNGCPDRSPKYVFDVDQVATIEGTKGFQDPRPQNGIDFSYQPGENLIMLYFVAEPMNSTDFNRRMFMALVRVKANESLRIDVKDQKFVEIGEFE